MGATKKKTTAKKTTTTTAAKKKTARSWTHPIAVTAPANEKHLRKLRAFALSLPGAAEALNHGRPCFTVRDKTFVMFMDDHHGDGRVAIWCKAPPGAQSVIVEADPERYFVPPYVGTRGWIGARLDRKPEWDAIQALVAESHAMTAEPPRRKR